MQTVALHMHTDLCASARASRVLLRTLPLSSSCCSFSKALHARLPPHPPLQLPLQPRSSLVVISPIYEFLHAKDNCRELENGKDLTVKNWDITTRNHDISEKIWDIIRLSHLLNVLSRDRNYLPPHPPPECDISVSFHLMLSQTRKTQNNSG